MIGDDVETSILESARRLCESMGVVVELRRSRIAGISLIRPDGYVAYCTRHPDGAAPLTSLRSVLERQTEPSNNPVPHASGT